MQQNPNKIRQKYANWPVLSLKLGQNGYPLKLAEIPDTPAALFYKGRIPTNSINVAIVGSRKISPYGAAAIKYIFNGLNDTNVCVISGLAYGIDAEAHKMAIKNGLRTVAILGTPIDHIYPYMHTRLAEDILADGGAVVSEGRPPDSENKTMKWSFAQRNRIIAGMCEAVIIIEAAENSGALITAEYARKYGRKVFAVPGSIFAENCAGTNSLLDKGAIPLTSLAGLLRKFPQIKNNDCLPAFPDEIKAPLNGDASILHGLMSFQPISIFELTGKINMPVHRISAALSMLEILGKVERLDNNKFRRTNDLANARPGS